MTPKKLMDCRGDVLCIGDVIRLPFDYILGPGSRGVDVMVFEPRDDGFGLGVITVTGLKAGLVWHVFPKISKPENMRALKADWLIDNWDEWFAWGYKPEPIPISDVVVLPCQGYRIVPRDA